LGPRYFVEDAIALRHRMFWTEVSDCFAIEELDKATWLVIARRVKEDAGCPIEFDGKASPPVEKQTRDVDGLPLTLPLQTQPDLKQQFVVKKVVWNDEEECGCRSDPRQDDPN
jgi:hypothetical protein